MLLVMWFDLWIPACAGMTITTNKKNPPIISEDFDLKFMRSLWRQRHNGCRYAIGVIIGNRIALDTLAIGLAIPIVRVAPLRQTNGKGSDRIRGQNYGKPDNRLG